jgi:UrcA family protein
MQERKYPGLPVSCHSGIRNGRAGLPGESRVCGKEGEAMINLKCVYLSSATVLAVLFAAAGAQAGQPAPSAMNDDAPVVEGRSLAGVPYEVVRIADLNLHHPEGMKTLRGRIKVAVNKVCGKESSRNYDMFRLNQECRQTAFADALGQVDRVIAQAEQDASEILVAAR